MLILLGFGAYVFAAVSIVAVASLRAPKMAFDEATHPAQECQVIEIPFDRLNIVEDVRRAA
jgi:hypothetical protein